MAFPVQPDDPSGPGGPSDPGSPAAPTPPTQPGTKIALQVSSTNVAITADQIRAAGGPWAKFTVRVTPLNKNGAGPSASTDGGYNPRVTEGGDVRATQSGDIRIRE